LKAKNTPFIFYQISHVVSLTPKGFAQCFHQKGSKTAIYSTSTKFLKKNNFGQMQP